MNDYHWALSEQAKREFQSNGVIKVDQLYTPSFINEAHTEVLNVEAARLASSMSPSDTNIPGFVAEFIQDKPYAKYIQSLFSEGPVFRKFANYRLFNIVSNILSCDDLYMSDIEVHIRNPGGSCIPRHQDNFYFNLLNARGVTCYIPLTRQTPDIGGLKYILGSHASRVLNHSKSATAAFSSEIDESAIDPSLAVMLPLYNLGDLTIHHPENIHFADPVSSASPRSMALSVRLFSSSEPIDIDAYNRYKVFMAANRSK